MFLLSPKDVEIISVQHPKRAKKVPILTYADKTFRLQRVFSAAQEAEAHIAWRDLTNKKGKSCILLEEAFRYSVWSQVLIDQGILAASAPDAYIKACLRLLQNLCQQAQTLGPRQAQDLIGGIQVNTNNQMQVVGGLETLLQIEATAEVLAPGILPRWEEDDLSALLLEMHRLGCKFFGRSKYTKAALESLEGLPPNDKVLFLSWLKLSLLGNLWLSRSIP